MTQLRLRAASPGSVDAALAAVERVVLTRHDGASYAEVADAAAPALVRALALAGVRAERCAVDLAPAADLLLARGLDLAPLPPGTVALDVVRLERIALGRITREVLRPRLFGALPPSEASRARCRELIRGERVAFEWWRTAWGMRSALRSGRARGSLRPAVFSRTRPDAPDGRVTTAGSDVTRWLFG